jgi:hypothetical protein
VNRPLALLSLAALGVLACLPGCVSPALDEGPPDEERDADEDALTPGTVAQAIATGCSTASVKALSQQIIDEASCLKPGAYALLPALSNVTVDPSVFPYLEQPARDQLVLAAKAHPSSALTLNSMLRTVAQQHMLYRWSLTGACGIGLAAWPGTSNHESGLAVDLEPHATWRPRLEARGFHWLGASDPVHFDYVGLGAVDHGGLDVLAFQRLWNRNNPGDPIAEDGDYGSQVESRLQKSPAAGFAKGASCGSGQPSATCQAVFVDICTTPHKPDIEWLHGVGWTSGCDAAKKLYCPTDAVNRGQMAAFLATALGLPPGPDAFVDDTGSAYEAAINAVAKAGITSGCDAKAKRFCPEDPVTRGQMAAFLAAGLKLPTGPDAFVDDETSPYEAAINAVAKAGITSGCDAAKKLYCPDDAVSRAQMATFLRRAFGG